MNYILIGLGIGISFWIVVIPSVLLIVQSKNKDETNKRSIELMEDRNQIDREKVAVLDQIRDALYRLSK